MDLVAQVDHANDVPAALAQHRVVVLRSRDLDLAEQVATMARLGTVVGSAPGVAQVRHEDDRRAHPDHRFFNEQWHADLSWCAEGPTITALYALEVDGPVAPTAFVDTVSGLARVSPADGGPAAGWSARHHVERSRVLRHGRGSPPPSSRRWTRRPPRPRCNDARPPTWVPEPGASHPVIVTDSATGRPGVLLGDHAWALDGVEDPNEGRHLIDDLQARVVAEGDRYVHEWRTGDLVVFDNRTLLHRREPTRVSGSRRVLRRTVAWPPNR